MRGSHLRLIQFFFASQMFLLMVATTSAQRQATEKCSPSATETPNSKYFQLSFLRLTEIARCEPGKKVERRK
jgi:hypothetical protein